MPEELLSDLVYMLATASIHEVCMYGHKRAVRTVCIYVCGDVLYLCLTSRL